MKELKTYEVINIKNLKISIVKVEDSDYKFILFDELNKNNNKQES